MRRFLARHLRGTSRFRSDVLATMEETIPLAARHARLAHPLCVQFCSRGLPPPPSRGPPPPAGASESGAHRLVHQPNQTPVRSEQSEPVVRVQAEPLEYRVEGAESQVLTVDLKAGQAVRAETSAMVYMTEGVEMDTNLGGGFMAAAKRYMTGENMFITGACAGHALRSNVGGAV